MLAVPRSMPIFMEAICVRAGGGEGRPEYTEPILPPGRYDRPSRGWVPWRSGAQRSQRLLQPRGPCLGLLRLGDRPREVSSPAEGERFEPGPQRGLRPEGLLELGGH